MGRKSTRVGWLSNGVVEKAGQVVTIPILAIVGFLFWQMRGYEAQLADRTERLMVAELQAEYTKGYEVRLTAQGERLAAQGERLIVAETQSKQVAKTLEEIKAEQEKSKEELQRQFERLSDKLDQQGQRSLGPPSTLPSTR